MSNAIHHNNDDAKRTTLCGRKETEAVEQDERGWCIACKKEFNRRFTELLSDADVDRMSESEAKALLKPKAAKRVR